MSHQERHEEEQEFSFKRLFIPIIDTKIFYFIIVLGLLVFSPTFFNGFVGDDFGLIVDNQLVHSLKNIPKLFLGSHFNIGGQFNGVYYKPLMSTYFSFVHTLSGTNAFLFHVFQLLFHIANAILIFTFLKNLLSRNVSFVLALIFLIHPINAESVVYIANSQEVLFLFFGLLALNFSKKNIQGRHTYFFIFLFLLSSLLSKETGLLFIPILLVSVYFFDKKKTLLYSGISILAILVYLFLRLGVAHLSFGGTIANPMSDMSLVERMMHIPEIIFFYIKTFFLPTHLVTPQTWFFRSINFENFYFPLIIDLSFFLILFIVGLTIFKKGTKWFKTYVFFFIWFIFGLGLHLQIFPLDGTVADRWFYFPIIGLLGMIGVGAEVIKGKLNVKKSLLVVLLIVLICTLSVRSFIRTTNWKDGLTLWTHDIKISQDNYLLEYGLGNRLFEAKRFDEAKIHLEKSIQLYPNGFNWYHLGVLHTSLGEHDKAIKAYQKAVSFGNNYQAYENLAFYLFIHGDILEAKRFIETALKKYPNSSRIWLSLALVEDKLGNHEAALASANMSYSFGQDKLNTYVYSRLVKNLPLNIKLK